jgi:predicted metal-dependent peptidase
MKQDADKRATELMTKAITAIVLDDPFYGYMLLRQEIIQDPSTETASTNGACIKYNPTFVKSLTLPQVKGLLKHEVMHVCHMHHIRRQSREPFKWNVAADYVINAHLKNAGVTLPDGGLIDPQYADYSAEHVYNMLPDQPQNLGGMGAPTWNFGGVEDAPGIGEAFGDDTVRNQLEEDVKIDILQAYNTAKIMGKLPAGMERLVESVRESRMPWRHLLARFFRATSKNDYSWLRPNRRFLAHGIYLPSLSSESLGPVVIGVDTSGSVAGVELEQFFGCINAILRQTRPEAIHVVYCDSEVANTQVFRPEAYPISLKQFKPAGGGGTDFRPVFDYVAKNKLKPCVLLYLTDMYGSFPKKAPPYPVIWCATSSEKAPFGKTLEIK